MDLELHVTEVNYSITLPRKPCFSSLLTLQPLGIALYLLPTQDGSERECTGPVALIGAHRCDKQAKKPKRDEVNNGSGRGNKRERKDSKRSHKQQQDREKRARMGVEDDEKEEDTMMDTDQVEDVSVVGTRTLFALW